MKGNVSGLIEVNVSLFAWKDCRKVKNTGGGGCKSKSTFQYCFITLGRWLNYQPQLCEKNHKLGTQNNKRHKIL
jgi:hypothetical protein